MPAEIAEEVREKLDAIATAFGVDLTMADRDVAAE